MTRRTSRRTSIPAGAPLPPPRTPFLFYQFFVAIYGGYFGAGAGILMLAALGMMGLTNIHTQNGLKNWGGLNINLVAVLIFAVSGIVNWPAAAAMAVGAALGGMLGARMAQRVGQVWVRRAVVGIGFVEHGTRSRLAPLGRSVRTR